MKNGNDSAYPIDAKDGFPACYGLTKREQFSILALQGLLVNVGRNRLTFEDAGQEAVRQADLLLAALEDAK